MAASQSSLIFLLNFLSPQHLKIRLIFLTDLVFNFQILREKSKVSPRKVLGLNNNMNFQL